jgi:hypothetical protein
LTEDGRPVPGALVWFLRSANGLPSGTGRADEVNATTDGNGFYQLALDQPASWASALARVTQTLYEDTVGEVDWGPGPGLNVTQNFRLYRSVALAAGESAHLAITRDNSMCDPSDEPFFCRTVHVTVRSSGTLVLDTIADDPPNTFLLAIGDPPFQNVTHITRSIDTATTVVVLVGRLWYNAAVPGGFTLKTALAP